MNGEVAFVVGWDEEEGEARLSLDEGEREIVLPVAALETYNLAWALTIHRAQGSQFPAVVAPWSTAYAVMLSRARTNVLVLNGNGVQGAAAQAASLVESRGYHVRKVGNAPHAAYAKTIVMYRPGFAREAKRFARDLNLGLVEPLDGMTTPQLRGAQIAVILGASR